jgi:hypothetical protein
MKKRKTPHERSNKEISEFRNRSRWRAAKRTNPENVKPDK